MIGEEGRSERLYNHAGWEEATLLEDAEKLIQCCRHLIHIYPWQSARTDAIPAPCHNVRRALRVSAFDAMSNPSFNMCRADPRCSYGRNAA